MDGPMSPTMTTKLDPAIVAAFGSATRVRTLAVLANSREPLTAYRIGVVGEVPFPKVYRELARLEKAWVVARRGRGWILLDAGLGDYLQRRVRMIWDEALVAEKARSAERTRRIYRLVARAGRPLCGRGQPGRRTRSGR